MRGRPGEAVRAGGREEEREKSNCSSRDWNEGGREGGREGGLAYHLGLAFVQYLVEGPIRSPGLLPSLGREKIDGLGSGAIKTHVLLQRAKGEVDGAFLC